MTATTYYRAGEWNFQCDICGRKQKSSQGEKTWNNLWVCRSHKEKRNPQDFLRAGRGEAPPAWVRPISADTFVAIDYTRSIAETIDITEAVTFGFSYAFGVTEAIPLTELTGIGTMLPTVEAIALSETVDMLLSRARSSSAIGAVVIGAGIIGG